MPPIQAVPAAGLDALGGTAALTKPTGTFTVTPIGPTELELTWPTGKAAPTPKGRLD